MYRLRCKVINACGTKHYTDKEINVYNPGVQNPCGNKVSMYPNPIKDGSVTLKLDYIDNPCDNKTNKNKKGFQVEVFDVYGTLIYQNKYTSNQAKINTNTFKTGIYFVFLKDANGNLEKKSLIIK